MKLWIAEKPELGRAIAKQLGVISKENGYIKCQNNNVVTWCFGHLIETIPPEQYDPSYAQWSLENLPLKMFPLQYAPIKGKESQVNLIDSLLKKANVAVNAGDVDDEGQLLVDELLIYLKWSGKTERVLIPDMSDEAVKKAIHNLKDNADFKGQYLKAYARAVGDFIYGINMTRCFSVNARAANYSKVVSIGRVQTPTLALIVDRYLQNKSHEESYFYELISTFQSNDIHFQSKLITSDLSSLPVDEKNRVIDASKLLEIGDKINGKNGVVTSVVESDKKTSAPLPYNLARLQQDMNKKYEFTADKTLKITQELRETHKCITYNRSDCSYLSMEQFNESGELISKLKSIEGYGEYSFSNETPSKAFNDKNVTAHTAIIPTTTIPHLDNLNDAEKKVYLAIVDLYLAQFLPPKITSSIEVFVNCEGYEFKSSSNKVLDEGFNYFLNRKNIEKSEESSDENIMHNALQKIKDNQVVLLLDSKIDKKKTTPPEIFTEATILSAMTRIADFVKSDKIKAILKEKDKDNKDEHGSIGTPATRSAILENLKSRGFIEVKKNKLIPSQSAIELMQVLPDLIRKPDLTAFWFLMQQEIEVGKMTVEYFVEKLYSTINLLIKEAEKIDFVNIFDTSESCPACNDGKVFINTKVASCDSCEFKIWRVVASKEISESAVRSLCKKGKTALIKGFKSTKTNKSFDAYLILNKEKNGVTFKFAK